MKPLSILLVDDNDDDVLLMREAFKAVDGEARLDVCECSVDVAAQLTSGPTPDLVLLDINMPVKNGFDLLAELKAGRASRRIPVIMFTTSVRPEDRDRALSMGAADYLVKPPEFEGLVKLVRRLIESMTGSQLSGPKSSRSSGFTLVELLCAIVIIGIVASAVLNRLHQSILKARRAAIVHYMGEEVRPAMNEYYMKHGQYPGGLGTADPTVTLKAQGYIAQTLTEKSIDVELTLTSQYFSGTNLVPANHYWYAWCLLGPIAVEFDLPCGLVRPGGMELTDTLKLPTALPLP